MYDLLPHTLNAFYVNANSAHHQYCENEVYSESQYFGYFFNKSWIFTRSVKHTGTFAEENSVYFRSS